MNLSDMKAYLCGAWDGTNLWVQWDDLESEKGYRLEVRYRTPGKDWQKWMPIESTGPYKRTWIVVPTWHEGWDAQARVGLFGEEDWVMAQEVTFLRSRCLFEFSTTTRRMVYKPPGDFSAIVDAAACTYRLEREVDIEPGDTVQVEMTAARLSGYCQLDYAGHFEINPNKGVVIRNVAPSEDDVDETGRDFTKIEALPFEAARIVFGENVMSGMKKAKIA